MKAYIAVAWRAAKRLLLLIDCFFCERTDWFAVFTSPVRAIFASNEPSNLVKWQPQSDTCKPRAHVGRRWRKAGCASNCHWVPTAFVQIHTHCILVGYGLSISTDIGRVYMNNTLPTYPLVSSFLFSYILFFSTYMCTYTILHIVATGYTKSSPTKFSQFW